ncbi:MAG: hypothetical protein EBU08_10900 [Micrococcales bacterium]|nr:hypothetical protein [Micrococcales bacterium]
MKAIRPPKAMASVWAVVSSLGGQHGLLQLPYPPVKRSSTQAQWQLKNASGSAGSSKSWGNRK